MPADASSGAATTPPTTGIVTQPAPAPAPQRDADGGRHRKKSSATFNLAPRLAPLDHQPGDEAPQGPTGRRSSRRTSSSAWKRRMSFAALGEVLPSLDLYRLGRDRKKRPSIGELHGDSHAVSSNPSAVRRQATPLGTTLGGARTLFCCPRGVVA